MEDVERSVQRRGVGESVSPDAAYFFATFADDRNRGDSAKSLLEAALKSDAPFAFRARGELYDRLSKSAAAPAKIDVKPPAETAKPTKAAPKSEGARQRQRPRPSRRIPRIPRTARFKLA